jgi:predicted transcriptional regulator
MVKITVSVDEGTARTLKTMAERLRKPQSLVVREAIAEYSARAGRLTELERRRMLRAIDDIVSRPSGVPQSQAEREIENIRTARRRGGRRRRVE